ncbi:hypothetical protein OAF42_02295 [Planctomicrobium sp.]|nr:hypothetical protein [Planctomicrobium sp.]MDB4733252.1 hypothetical protein [Planctomicrobium sp.]
MKLTTLRYRRTSPIQRRWTNCRVVSRSNEDTVQNDPYLRLHDDEMQQRQHDENGDDWWLPVK